MSDQPQMFRLRDLPAALINNKWVQIFAAALVLLELYNHGAISTYINAQKATEAQAIADNAALRQRGEAEIQEWKAITEMQIATYADRKQKVEACKATADARIAAAEETIARETATVSEIRAKAEAKAAEGDANIKEQQAIVERERAAQAQRLNQAKARAKEYETADQRLETMLAKQMTENPEGFAGDAMDAAMRRSGWRR